MTDIFWYYWYLLIVSYDEATWYILLCITDSIDDDILSCMLIRDIDDILFGCVSYSMASIY